MIDGMPCSVEELERGTDGEGDVDGLCVCARHRRPRDRLVRQILQLRPNMAVATDPSIADVHSFESGLDVLVDFGAIDPADNLIAGSHGTSEGQLLLSLDPTTASPATYESLQKVDASGSIRIPPAIIKPNAAFRLMGCLIGSDDCLPFLVQLKKALGNAVGVTAPRYVHSFYVTPDGTGVFEFMKAVYRIVRKEGFKTRDQVVGTYANGTFPQPPDNTSVPDESWEGWVPGAAALKLKPAISDQISFDFPLTISPPAGGYKAIYKGLASWYAFADQPTFKVLVDGAIPPTEAGQVAALPQVLAQADTFKSTHPYPVYKRFHLASTQAFIDAFSWRANVLPQNTLQFIGTRYRYELLIPIVKPGTKDELIYNYYPASGGNATINFDERNQPYKFYGVV
jgi:hypothetical protein